MKRIPTAVLAAALLAGGPAIADDFVAAPARVVMLSQVGTGTTAQLYLICVDDGGGQGGGCYGHDDVPRWTVRRCSAEGCDFAFPLTLESTTKVHFSTATPGTYYVLWTNGNAADPKAAGAVLQRGPIEFPPPIQP